MTKFEWTSFEIEGPKQYSLSRFEMQKRKYLYHSHDFAEIFWIDRGRCTHVINQVKTVIDESVLTFIRPADEHKFIPAVDNNPLFYNIAFTIDTYRYFYDRYADCMGVFFPKDTDLPVTVKIENNIRQFLTQSFEELSISVNSRQNIERFLLNLFHELDFVVHERVPNKLPDWMIDALRSLRQGKVLEEGADGFIKRCHRSSDHVNREVKRCLGVTVGELINRERLRCAASQLQTTSLEIIEIAYNCGYKSLSHFYKRFKEHYGVTPRQYRLQTNGCLHEW